MWESLQGSPEEAHVGGIMLAGNITSELTRKDTKKTQSDTVCSICAVADTEA